MNGSLLGKENNIIVCFTYISPEGSPIYNDIIGRHGIDTFESKLFEIVSKYPNAGFVLAGDFNSRCGEVQNVTIDDNVDFIFDENVVYGSDNVLLKRQSKDACKACNTFGRSLIDWCKTYGVHF